MEKPNINRLECKLTENRLSESNFSTLNHNFHSSKIIMYIVKSGLLEEPKFTCPKIDQPKTFYSKKMF